MMLTRLSWMDVRLGGRMLVKYPGLTLVGTAGMAVAIAIGACAFTIFYSYLQPTVPLYDGHRVVGIAVWDTATSQQERRTLHDFVAWRTELTSVEHLGAFRPVRRNLILPGGATELARVAEMTASGFRVAHVPPLLGRHLAEEDERPGAPPVVVIGHDVWQTRLGADPSVLGRTLQLGEAIYTIVGVMPEGFAFPMNDRFWVPLRANTSDYERRNGPALTIFGRLAAKATFDTAQAELSALGLRAAAAHPETHERLRPRLLPYTGLFMDGTPMLALHVMQFFISLLLVVICANVAILVYARTTTRHGEIVVRSALGASRTRIVAQLFVEALVLSTVAAAGGLALTSLVLRQVDAAILRETAHLGGLPFWIDFGLSFGTIVYVVGLALAGALIVGVIPAIKATGRRLETGLRQLGGSAGMRLGGTWTALIVAQVALAVAVLPGAIFYAWDAMRYATRDPGFAVEQYLAGSLEMDRQTPPTAEAEAYERAFVTRYASLQEELRRKLAAEPGVSNVTFAATAPGQEPTVRIEIERAPGEPAAPRAGSRSADHTVRAARVDVGYFETFDVPVLIGRGFQAADLDASAAAYPVVVDRSFASALLGTANPLGRRLRYIRSEGDGDGSATDATDSRWYEIVGVVADFPSSAVDPALAAGALYHPIAPGAVYPVDLTVRLQGVAPAAFAARMRTIAAAIHPALQLRETRPMDEVLRQEEGTMRLTAYALGLLASSVLLLSAAGIYALMSFTVAQRRREIGVRSALGADPRQILVSIFSRVLRQLAAGVALGLLVAGLLDALSEGEMMKGNAGVVLPSVAALMMAAGLAAAIGPARRGLRVQPTEALREQ